MARAVLRCSAKPVGPAGRRPPSHRLSGVSEIPASSGNFRQPMPQKKRRATKCRPARGKRNRKREHPAKHGRKHPASKRQAACPFPLPPSPLSAGKGYGCAGAAPPRPAGRGFCLRRLSLNSQWSSVRHAPILPCSLASLIAFGATGAALWSATRFNRQQTGRPDGPAGLRYINRQRSFIPS